MLVSNRLLDVLLELYWSSIKESETVCLSSPWWGSVDQRRDEDFPSRVRETWWDQETAQSPVQCESQSFRGSQSNGNLLCRFQARKVLGHCKSSYWCLWLALWVVSSASVGRGGMVHTPLSALSVILLCGLQYGARITGLENKLSHV